MVRSSPPARRWLAPEVVQTSALDCGPAALKCLLDGFGGSISYGRLREACQTDVDGTSIDVIEEVAIKLGLQAEQIILPLDHLLLEDAAALPALLVVTQPGGLTHFVVLWRRHGPWVQVMDPAGGRRWMRTETLLRQAYVHSLPVPADGWREWAGSEEFQATLRRRIESLGVRTGDALLAEALANPGWHPLASLDASVRLVRTLRRAGAVRAGGEVERLLRELWARERDAPDGAAGLIPAEYWSVRPHPTALGEEEELQMRGAVLIRVRGFDPGQALSAEALAAESPELAAAVQEAPCSPGRELLRLLRGDGALRTSVLLVAAVTAAASVVVEGLVLRGAMALGERLGLVEQRLGAVGFLLVFLLALVLVEAGVAHQLLRLGRRAELRLRLAFHAKVPRLHDRYFHSRPVSDMAERAHALQHVRSLARFGGQIVRVLVQLIATAAGIVWLYPASAGLAVVAAVFSLLIPFLLLPFLQEQDLRLRTHNGSIARLFLDSLLGMSSVRAHGAQEAVRSEHESLLVEWMSTGRQRVALVAYFEVIQVCIGMPLVLAILLQHGQSGASVGGLLLLAYWANQLPTLGAEFVFWARQYPVFRSVFLRLIEPLAAPGEREPEPPVASRAQSAAPPGVSIDLEGVSIRAGGHVILDGVTARIEAGSHVAIVGPSGAGKSSLVGLLLGWHRPATGSVSVDGEPLDPDRLDALRREAAWLEPTVQLWNRSLLENLTYGTAAGGADVADVLSAAELYDVLDRLPLGLQTPLGESGRLVSGGEGQRVRFARALLRRDARLVVIDEPFRGLDRAQRRRMLAAARRVWKDATLLCVMHDLDETRDFDQVLVMAGGRVVEDGSPASLLRKDDSPYRELLQAEVRATDSAWSSSRWRRLHLVEGALRHEGEPASLVRDGGR